MKLLIFIAVLGVGWVRTGRAESIQTAEKARAQANDDFYHALEAIPSEQRTPEKVKELEKKHIEPAQSRLRRALKSDLDQRVQKYGFKPVTEKEYDRMISKQRSSDPDENDDPETAGSAPAESKKSGGAVQYKKTPAPSASDKPVRSSETPAIDGSGIRKEIDF